MQAVVVGDAAIAHSQHGVGEPIVLVHPGVFGDWFLPVSASPSLQGFRVIRVHRPGYGPAPPQRHLTLGDHAHAVAALVDRLALPRINWVGHSSSCQMGLELAIVRPDRVHSLVLLEPAAVGGFTVPATEELVRQFAGPAMEAFAAGDMAAAFDNFIFRDSCPLSSSRGSMQPMVRGFSSPSSWSKRRERSLGLLSG